MAVYKLDDRVSDRVAAPINCALATVINALSGKPANVKQTGKALVQVRLIQCIVENMSLDAIRDTSMTKIRR